MSENGEIYTAGKNFTLPPAVAAVTNSTSGSGPHQYKNILPYKEAFLQFAKDGDENDCDGDDE